MDATAQLQLREAWLEQAASFLQDYMAAHGFLINVLPRVSCGWPSSGGLALRAPVVGECCSPAICDDGRPQIFITPRIADSVEVLGTLLHELLHAAVGFDCGHGKKFSQVARKVGLVGKPTATTVGENLKPLFELFITRHGQYPHSAVRPPQKPAPGSRLRLYHCNCKPPVKVRAAGKMVELKAKCLICDSVFRPVTSNISSYIKKETNKCKLLIRTSCCHFESSTPPA